ncbi:hypothetical protein [Desulfomarina sp.]
MFDWFNLLLLAVVLLIVGFIAIAVRMTLGEMKGAGLRGDDARRYAEEIRKRDIKCPRCSRQSSALLGTGNRYKCDTCNYVFEGPVH